MTHQNKTDETFSSPYKTRNQKVLSEWIDYNGHMNVAYYTLAFDKALDFFLKMFLGLDLPLLKKIRKDLLRLKLATIILVSYWKKRASLWI